MTAKHIHVTGIVQGVGFRPFVYGLAVHLGLHGWVCNTSSGVDIVVEGDERHVLRFVDTLSSEPPPLAHIDGITSTDAEPGGYAGFEIHASLAEEGASQPISPDIAVCPDCERELFDPSDHRYLYPFINCTNCGPRFTIIRDMPYDRPLTTMAEFAMCPACQAEYSDPGDRRFHAQPVACPECGPSVQLRASPGSRTDVASIDLRLSAILKARQLLRNGRIVAVKGLGGFHLACDAGNPDALAALRRRKNRSDKPFALMMADLATVNRYCKVSAAELQLLTGREKPIVLLRRGAGSTLPEDVAPGMDTLGVMLPYTPLHHLLINQRDARLCVESVPPVLVLTSGNFSDEPIATANEDALRRLAPLADAFLLHDRAIQVRCDDSVVRVDRDQPETVAVPVFLRRSRGYAPYPVTLPFTSVPVLALGGDLKNAFCLARQNYAFLSQYIGDLEEAAVLEALEQAVEHLSRLFHVDAERVAHDLHPGYFSTKAAFQLSRAPRVPVQHHHAHVAACMADNGLPNRRVIGMAWDGTGYGTDGTIWGGEILSADYASFDRLFHLEYLPLPGGDSAIRHPWRTAVAYAVALGMEIDDLPFLRSVDRQAVTVVQAQVRKGINTAKTSSMGRLFDAVAALAGLRNSVTFEAQAAMELEVRSRPHIGSVEPYPFQVSDDEIRVAELLRAVVEDARGGAAAGIVGARFHLAVSAMAVEAANRVHGETGLSEVVLGGGVWQNELLLGLARTGLQRRGFRVYTHRQTPTNDSGLALGQAAVANFAS